ncbi:hypothetical protein EMCG_08339 [[Emmonsia] crescens]|uniref:Protein transporter SEC61 subunit beta n=1 Tax=[Emmonsia] crescens TaxID=73230 RepID=A0A0G2J4K4_9EURO|nr:hypothetical protein EMCG_08339 [Emmonsia crescens UAMH 3008]
MAVGGGHDGLRAFSEPLGSTVWECRQLDNHRIAMIADFLPGNPLDKVWLTLDEQQCVLIREQLAGHLKLFRSCTQPYIGRVDRQPTRIPDSDNVIYSAKLQTADPTGILVHIGIEGNDANSGGGEAELFINRFQLSRSSARLFGDDPLSRVDLLCLGCVIYSIATWQVFMDDYFEKDRWPAPEELPPTSDFLCASGSGADSGAEGAKASTGVSSGAAGSSLNRPSSPTPPGGPRTAMRRRAAADHKESIRNARPASTRSAGAGGSSGTMLKLYTDESPGLKVDPVVVLVLSLGFIFSVVGLHGCIVSRLVTFN